ncbi:hypothetical protein CGCF413_v009018 [Colletotrichum fructicola]|nr:hypothetical protein CGCF413_v009018 [Colletotrichum fructicola]
MLCRYNKYSDAFQTASSWIEAREKLWVSVFKGWTSNDEVPVPDKIPDREFSHTAIQIGVLAEDAPAPGTSSSKSGNKKTATGEPPTPFPHKVKPCRKAGAPVFLKVNRRWTDEIIYPKVDSKGSSFPNNVGIIHPPGFHLPTWKGRLMLAHDDAEMTRIGRINLQQVVFWVRHRVRYSLVNNLRGRESCLAGDDGGKENQPHTAAHFYTPILTTEDHSQLRQIDLIADSAGDNVFSFKMLLDVACTYRYEDKTGFGQ